VAHQGEHAPGHDSQRSGIISRTTIGVMLSAAGIIGANVVNADLHLNDPEDSVEVTQNTTAIDINSSGGTVGELGVYALGRSIETDIGKDAWAIATADTQVLISYPFIAQLKPGWNGQNIVVTRQGASGKQLPIDQSDISLQPVLGQLCKTENSGGFRAFMCKDDKPEHGRIDLVGRSGIRPSSGDHLIDDAMRSLNLLLTDRYCFEQLMQVTGGDPNLTLQYALRSHLREVLAVQYGIPPSVVIFDDANFKLTTPLQPLSTRLATVQKSHEGVRSPFTKESDIDTWCQQTITRNGTEHHFIDPDTLKVFVKKIAKLGGSEVEVGVWPTKKGIVKNIDRDLRRRIQIKIDPRITNNELTFV
jgi:hypothetical protein